MSYIRSGSNPEGLYIWGDGYNVHISEGKKEVKIIPQKIMDSLMYSSYEANRDLGMTHEQLISLGVGNEGMKTQYESNNFTKQIQIY